MSQTATSTPPVAYPNVDIGGRTYTLKFNQLAEYLISYWGLDLAQVLSIVNPASKDPRRFAYAVQLFAACVGHEFLNATPRQDPPTPEQWIQQIPEDEITKIFMPVGIAVGKLLVDRARKTTLANPTPPAETPAQTPVQ